MTPKPPFDPGCRDVISDRPVIHRKLAECHILEGNLDLAAEEAEDLVFKRDALSVKAIILVNMGLISEAKKAAEELKELIEKGIFKNDMRRYYHLMGRIEKKRGIFPGPLSTTRNSSISGRTLILVFLRLMMPGRDWQG